MFDYSIRVVPVEEKFKLTLTIDNKILIDELYNNYVAASVAAEKLLNEEYKKRGRRNEDI